MEMENDVKGAQRIAALLEREWPDVPTRVREDGVAIIDFFGRREDLTPLVERATHLRERFRLDFDIEVITSVQCSQSGPLNSMRRIGESVPSIALVDVDDRGVVLFCSSGDGHFPHDWDDYIPLGSVIAKAAAH